MYNKTVVTFSRISKSSNLSEGVPASSTGVSPSPPNEAAVNRVYNYTLASCIGWFPSNTPSLALPTAFGYLRQTLPQIL